MKPVAWFLAVLAAVACFRALPVLAEEPEKEGAAGIPAYAVARLKVLDGSVWVRPAVEGEWEEFSTNSPVPPSSRISVPEASEGELQFHGGQFVLLTTGTDLEIRDLKDDKSIFRLRAGEIRFDLPPDDFAPVAVRIPGGARVQIPVPGKFWIIVDDDDQTRLVVRSGEATVSTDAGEFRVQGGELAVIGQGVSVSPYGKGNEVPASPPPAESGNDYRVPPNVNTELQSYGEWVSTPEYGYVWRPYVSTGWAPYTYGRWVWITPYGWTWVSDEPWGWYPYRCGYWVTVPAYGWCWYPYNAFFSVSIGVGYGDPYYGYGGYPYYGYRGYPYYYRNARYYPSTVRFIPEGTKTRWIPLQPGEKYRPATASHTDPSLARYNRSVPAGQVFVRTGADRSEKRDWTAVRAEQQAEPRQTRPAKAASDTRVVRPEMTRGGRVPAAPNAKGKRGDSGSAPMRSMDRYNGGAVQRRDRGLERSPSGNYERSITAPAGRATTPSDRSYVPRETAPERGRGERDAAPAVPRGREPVLRSPVPREDRPVVVPDSPDRGGRGGGVERAPGMGYGGGGMYDGGGRGGGGSRSR